MQRGLAATQSVKPVCDSNTCNIYIYVHGLVRSSVHMWYEWVCLCVLHWIKDDGTMCACMPCAMCMILFRYQCARKYFMGEATHCLYTIRDVCTLHVQRIRTFIWQSNVAYYRAPCIVHSVWCLCEWVHGERSATPVRCIQCGAMRSETHTQTAIGMTAFANVCTDGWLVQCMHA